MISRRVRYRSHVTPRNPDEADPARGEHEPESSAAAQPEPDAAGSKTLSGISILGNQEAPKALVIVPWKSSEIGDPLGLAENLDGSRRPVDRTRSWATNVRGSC